MILSFISCTSSNSISSFSFIFSNLFNKNSKVRIFLEMAKSNITFAA